MEPPAGVKKSFLDKKKEQEEKKLIEFVKPVDETIKEKLHSMAKNGFGVSNPSLITLDLITKKINEWKEEKKIYSQEITHEGCQEIALSFCNLLQISNLDNLKSLEVLRLDNNMIMKIEGLDSLVNIKWLDLSFNFITQIEGLNKLVNLTDLSLFANQITEVNGGLDENRKLNVLSLGKNLISNAKEMTLYLKKFTNLQALCVHMNSFCKDEDSVQKVIEENDSKSQDTFPPSYNIILQNLKYLKYLDWKPLSDEMKSKAKQTASTTTGKEDKEDSGEAEEKRRQEEAALRKADLQDVIDFFKKVRQTFKDDISEFDQLKKIKGIEEAINSADKMITDQIETFKKVCKGIQAKKEADIEFKMKELEKNEEKFIEKSKELIRAFKRKFKEFVHDLPNKKDELSSLGVDEVQKQIGLEQLKIDLLEIEVYVKDKNKGKLEEFRKKAEDNNRLLGAEAEKLKSSLDSFKGQLKESTMKAANDAKAQYDAYNDNFNGNGEGKEDEEGQEKKPIIPQQENDDKYKEYMETLKVLFGENRAGEVMSDIEKIHEVLDDKISKLKDGLDTQRALSHKAFFDNLNDKESYRNKKRIEDIIEIYDIYYEKIRVELDKIKGGDH